MEIKTKDREFRFQGRLFKLPEVLLFTGGSYFYEATAYRKPRKGDFFVSHTGLFAAVASQAQEDLKDRRIIVERRAKAIVKGYWVEDTT